MFEDLVKKLSDKRYDVYAWAGQKKYYCPMETNYPYDEFYLDLSFVIVEHQQKLKEKDLRLLLSNCDALTAIAAYIALRTRRNIIIDYVSSENTLRHVLTDLSRESDFLELCGRLLKSQLKTMLNQ